MKRTQDRYVPALGFAPLTRLYDPVVALTTREAVFKKSIIREAAIQPGHVILDLGCRTGTLAIWTKQAHPGAHIAGLDGDATIIETARRKAQTLGPDIDFVQGLSCNIEYSDGRFDRVVSTLFFHHLTSDAKQRTLREAYRVLRPGGELHIADWGQPANALMRGLFFFVRLLDGFETTADNVHGALPRLMQEAGFSEVEIGRSYPTVFGTLSLFRARKP